MTSADDERDPTMGDKAVRDSIAVTNEPPHSENDAAGSGERATYGTERAMTPFDTEDDDFTDFEDPDSPLSLTVPEPQPADSLPDNCSCSDSDQACAEIGLEPTLENILKVMQDAHDMLFQNTIRKNQKEDTRNKMAWAIKHVKAMSVGVKDTQIQQERQGENTCLKGIWAELTEIKKAVKQTYAQAVAGSTRTPTHHEPKHTCATPGHGCGTGGTRGTKATAQHEPQFNEEYEKDRARTEQAKKDVIITARDANDDVRTSVANNKEEEIRKGLQQIIQGSEDTSTVEVKSVKKLAKHTVRIRCHTESDATKVKQLDWKEIFGGATVVKTEYGVVIHGVAKYLMANLDNFKTLIEKANGIKITRVAPLIKNARNPDAPTQSIIIFTVSAEEANKCIDSTVTIERRRYEAERYTPQCQIKQCFNCQAYGHKADTCKKKPVCGKCAQDHETRDCGNEQVKCANCGEAHCAWHYQCSKRQGIAQTMEARRSKAPIKYLC